MDYVLDANDIASLQAHLRSLDWLPDEPIVSAQRIGDGNMNMTVRVRSMRSSFILKQARPWVVKYPHIPAPVERASVEACFYGVTSLMPAIASRLPRLYGFDPASNLLWLEDLGEAGDLMELYHSERMSNECCVQLSEFLVTLHNIDVPVSSHTMFRNRAMRKLNHEHQYDLPLRSGNGIDLENITPGLAALAERLKADRNYCERIASLGNSYLADGTVLVHGDFFPGSWLVTRRGVVVIDPEFCYLGAPEYDLGIFLAHLELIGVRPLWTLVRGTYNRSVDWTLATQFAGAEIMRRLIGVAQLPIVADIEKKRAWLETSRSLVCAR